MEVKPTDCMCERQSARGILCELIEDLERKMGELQALKDVIAWDALGTMQEQQIYNIMSGLYRNK